MKNGGRVTHGRGSREIVAFEIMVNGNHSMAEAAAFVSLQGTIASLQHRVNELEELLRSSMEETIDLVQKSARADALQQQINRLLGDQATRELSKRNQMEMDYETQLTESNRNLHEKLDEALRQRDELLQAALQTQLLRDMLDQKHRTILDLMRENSELRSRKKKSYHKLLR
jgi:hypothetical protein